jgi:hypothetical protein
MIQLQPTVDTWTWKAPERTIPVKEVS